MMDRHLIYPPGWDKKKKSDWDADPSLKGKKMPIQGTSIVLDNPEALDAWLAERKKLWPTAGRIQEKKTRLEEAISRGQLPPMSSYSRGTKRLREERNDHRSGTKTRRRAPNDQTTKGCRTFGKPPPSLPPREIPTSSSQVVQYVESSTSDSDDDETPEAVSSKLPVPPPPGLSDSHVADTQEKHPESFPSEPPVSVGRGAQARPKRKEPKMLPHNPFASRPTLLRNLIVPEIRITTSNLSQAIRFLVDNDFLRNVELKPGQADEKLIEVVDSLAGDQ